MAVTNLKVKTNGYVFEQGTAYISAFPKNSLTYQIQGDKVEFRSTLKDYVQQAPADIRISNLTVNGTAFTNASDLSDALDDIFSVKSGNGGGGGVTVIDNLTSTSSTNALSANQGRILNGKFANYVQTGSAVSQPINIVTSDSATISGSPMIVADTTSGNALSIDRNGLKYNEVDILTTANTDHTGIIYVNGSYTGTQEDGTVIRPYKTIQAAITAASSYKDILVAPGTYNESLSFVSKTGVNVKALSPIGNRPNVEITGSLNIDIASMRIGINGLSFDGATTIDSSNGNIYLQFINFNDEVVFEGNGYVSCRTCWFNGLTWTEGNIECNGCYDEDVTRWVLNAPGYTFAARDCLNLVITHNAGVAIFLNSFFSTVTGTSIISSASGTGDAIYFQGGTLQQIDGSYGVITKTGVCPYSLGTLAYGNENSLTLSGTRVDSGLGGSQVFIYTPTPGYDKTDFRLVSHLIGISNKLQEYETRIAALEP